MDGYAVRAQDTFGASESLPALLARNGEVPMGRSAAVPVGEGQAVRIPTGGMLPPGADSVVMIEYCRDLDEFTLEVNRTVSPLENVIQPGDDFRRGAVVLSRGRRLRPADLGALAGLGLTRIEVYRKPRVAILSTGDEIVPAEALPGPGQVRDINQHTLGGLCRQAGAEPILLGLCPDRFELIAERVAEAFSQADTLWISGGSSVGTRDLTLQVLETLPAFELLAHGISISPGKPTILARSGSRPIIGLPGHVASTLVVAEIFLTRLLARLAGWEAPDPRPGRSLEAVLTRNVASASGREDFVRVRLLWRDGRWLADPIFGKSGLISTLVEADGLMPIDLHTEGLYEGQKVRVLLFPN